ncbi:MAG TPA: ABC transporter substrate-binding protein [Allocoleopsis sp.]
MSQKNETPVLLLSLLITLGLIGGGLWWLGNRLHWGNFASLGNSSSQPNGTTTQSIALQDRFSSGDKLLTGGGVSAEKQAAIAAMGKKNYAAAIPDLEAALQAKRNDPEALIYLNNARIGNKKAYTIAVSVPLATAPEPALEILRGVAQAQNEINQNGGIQGVPLKVVTVSDDNDPSVVRQVASALVQDDAVLGVVGHFGSDASLAGADIYQNGGLVMISPTSTSVEIANKGNYVFRTVPSDRFTATTLVSYLLDKVGKQNTVVYFNSGSDYSTSLKNQFTTALTTGGGQVIEEVDVSAANFNAGQSIERAQQRGADVLVLATNTPTLQQALQVIQANQRQFALVGGDSLYNPQVLQVGQANAEGMVVAVPWIVLSHLQSPFVQASQKLWGGDVNWRTAMAYDATLALIEGLTQNPTRQGIQQTLASPDFEFTGATGTVRFLASGDRNQPMQLVQIEPGRRSGYGYDFVPMP